MMKLKIESIYTKQHLYSPVLKQLFIDLYIFWHKGAGTNSITESFSENVYKLGEGSFFPEKCITLNKFHNSYP